LILILYELNKKFKKMGSGLAFCLSHACLKRDQEFHISAVKSHWKDESLINIFYHQDEIARLPYLFIKRERLPAT